MIESLASKSIESGLENKQDTIENKPIGLKDFDEYTSDITDSIDKDFENKEKNISHNIDIIKNKKELLEHNLVRESEKLNSYDLIVEFSFIITKVLELLRDIGLDEGNPLVDKLEDLKLEIDGIKDQKLIAGQNVEHIKNKLNAFNGKQDNLNEESDSLVDKRELYEDRYKNHFEQIDKYATEHNLSDEDKENIHQIKNEFIVKLEQLDMSAKDIELCTVAMDNYVIESAEELRKEIDDFDVDIKAVFENATEDAVIGAGIGLVTGGPHGAGIGALWGGVAGVAGNLAKQYAIYQGASENVATVIQMSTELVTPAGIAKASGRAIFKTAKTAVDDVIVNTKTIKSIDDIGRFSRDKIKTLEFETKGLINDVKPHTFIDGHGKELVARIDEVIDTTRTIKMPYLGSNLKNGVNSAGFKRDSSYFAKEYLKEFPETLSQNNQKLAALGKSPMVDKQWIKHNPNHESFLGQKLHHHHINNTDMTGYVPEKLHNGKINKVNMHVDNMKFGDEVLSLAKEKISRS